MTVEMKDGVIQPIPESAESIMDVIQGALKKAHGESAKACSVCGKPSSKDHKKLNDDPKSAHAKAKAFRMGVYEGAKECFEWLEKATKLRLDMLQTKQINGQRELLKVMLNDARKEHDAYEPTTVKVDVENSGAMRSIMKLLWETADLMGAPVKPRSEGWTALQVAEYLRDAVKSAAAK